MSNLMEEFPALPVIKKSESTVQRSPSTFSSVSTTSIGASEDLRVEIPNGKYRIMNSIFIRPSLYCECRNCLATYPTADNFEGCEYATFLAETQVVCRVTASKVVRHRNEKFSVAYIRSDATMVNTDSKDLQPREVRGWVKSKHLDRIHTASRSAAPVFNLRQNEVDRSRSPSVLGESRFQFGDLVLVNIAAKGEKWVRGEVRQEKPLMILVEGTSTPQRFHARSIKDHETRPFVAVRDLNVRRNKFRGDWSCTTLKAGTTVRVAYMDGQEGRIIAPVQGWISMRDTHSLYVIEPSWTDTQERDASIIVSNLPGGITQEVLRRQLFLRGYFQAKTITFQRKGDQFRAVVTLNSRTSVSKLVEQGSVEIQHGWRCKVEWNKFYLKNVAKRTLHKLNKRETRI